MNELVASFVHAAGQKDSGSSDYDLNADSILPADRKLRPAGVLIAVRTDMAEPQVILTKRSSSLKHHPGQIAFPGGKMEATDEDVHHTALREAKEEIGLSPADVEIVGEVAPHETVTGFEVTPVLGLVRRPFFPVPEPGEVAEVFMVPLHHVVNIENYMIASRRWRGQRRHYYVVPYGP